MIDDMYVLDGDKSIRLASSIEEWGDNRKDGAWRVALDEIDGARVSTVFLGIDHRYLEPRPVLFETMVFGGPLDGEMDRCSTWDEAEQMHANMLRRVRDAAS